MTARYATRNTISEAVSIDLNIRSVIVNPLPAAKPVANSADSLNNIPSAPSLLLNVPTCTSTVRLSPTKSGSRPKTAVLLSKTPFRGF